MRFDRTDPTEAYTTDDRPHMLAYGTAEDSVALPYSRVKTISLGPDESRIDIDYRNHEVRITGTNLGKLWRELRAYRVTEVSINAGAVGKALGDNSEHCLVESIEIRSKDT